MIEDRAKNPIFFIYRENIEKAITNCGIMRGNKSNYTLL